MYGSSMYPKGGGIQSIISLILPRKRYVYFDVTNMELTYLFLYVSGIHVSGIHTRLNQVGVAVSYDTTIGKIAKLHQKTG